MGHGWIGLVAFPALAWLASEHRREVSWKLCAKGVAVQLLLAVLLLKLPVFQQFFTVFQAAVMAVQEATTAGTSFVFGFLGGATLPYEETSAGASFILAVRALPLILVVSALSSLLFYWRILPVVVNAFSFLLEKSIGIGGALGLGVAANIFIGMVEAPLVVRPYLEKMTRSELFTVMTSGMATIAGNMMVLYAFILRDAVPGIMGHILVASIISAPAAVVIAGIMVPETGHVTSGRMVPPRQVSSAMDALTRGALDGIQLLINIMALLIVFVALIHLVNQVLGSLPVWGGEPVTLQKIMGYLMAPFVWLMGIPWAEAQVAGSLMGTKTILNELLSYLELAKLPPEALGARGKLIMTYAMCGFANLGSLGIVIGGLGALIPDRREEVVALGLRSIVAGTLATAMTGAIAGIFYSS